MGLISSAIVVLSRPAGVVSGAMGLTPRSRAFARRVRAGLQ
jgi:hypothetical protein